MYCSSVTPVCVLKLRVSDLELCICKKKELAAGDSSRRQLQGQVDMSVTARIGNLCLTKNGQDSWCLFSAARAPLLTTA